jgi:hypothetical protein
LPEISWTKIEARLAAINVPVPAGSEIYGKKERNMGKRGSK